MVLSFFKNNSGWRSSLTHTAPLCPLHSGEEVFDSYGCNLSPIDLLLDYGELEKGMPETANGCDTRQSATLRASNH